MATSGMPKVSEITTDDQDQRQEAQRVGKPAGSRRKFATQGVGQTDGGADHRWRSGAARRHGRNVTEMVEPTRISSSGGASRRMRTGKRCAILTQFKVRGTRARPPNTVMPSSATTPQP